MEAGTAEVNAARNFCQGGMWSPASADGQPLTHPDTKEVGGGLRKREVLSLGTLPLLTDASTSVSHDTQDP